MKLPIAVLLIFISLTAFSQKNLSGAITDGTEPLPYATVQLTAGDKAFGQVTDGKGRFSFSDVPVGRYRLAVRLMGYQAYLDSIEVDAGDRDIPEIKLKEDRLNLENVVVSATRYELDRKEAPVIVNLIDDRLLSANQSIAISEALNFQSGVRVESNCQNCGFTQVRLNGLDGAYSQILINSRPVFSALTSVYGLEQIPAHIVDRIEIVRSGGSALFGSNAIAGTINIITREPVSNAWQVSTNHALIAGEAQDHAINFNSSIVNDDLTAGITFYGMVRDREAWDANEDGFTELVEINSKTIGSKGFFMLGERTKATIDFSAIEEYRRGGDRLDIAPHFTDITEELDHNTIFYGLNIDHTTRDQKGNVNAYISGQNTSRDSYYGGLGGSRTAEDSAVALSAYGLTTDFSMVGGVRYTHSFNHKHVTTTGVENQNSIIKDEIPGYNRIIDQSVMTYALYVQHEWKPGNKITALLGGRYDYTLVAGNYTLANLERDVDQQFGVFSPRLTLLYDLSDNMQLRGGYSRGFRAPQAFNEDLHISSAGGEQRFVLLSNELKKETSDALTASLNYTKNFGVSQFDALIEGFYTRLSNPFTLVNTGNELASGAIIDEVRNGNGAVVSGVNFEANYTPSSYFLFQLGGTLQKSRFLESQILFEIEDPTELRPNVETDQFVRNPDLYGYMVANWSPTKKTSIDLTGTYTGSMIVPRVIDESGYLELRNSESFLDVNLKITQKMTLSENLRFDLMGGVQNILNSFQSDFDTGAGRDSDYVYGPIRPRTFFFGVKIGG